jgi:maltooligosyltrehalose trehalohydrolase
MDTKESQNLREMLRVKPSWTRPLGAQPYADGTLFRVWAADADRVEVVLFPADGDDAITAHAMIPQAGGYFNIHLPGVLPGTCYQYRLDGRGPFPDPASRFQPDSVHGPSQVVDSTQFAWTDQSWRGITLDNLVIYELHVGTATPEGTFDGLIPRLDAIRELGVTAIELMPVADFPGTRNWGYEGVCLFAPARIYGGPEALRRLVDAAHARGLAVILDAVFNHVGPDGNYLGQYSKSYFTDRYPGLWGDLFNFDGLGSRSVRDFFIANAHHWVREYHIDGLRLDAIHAMRDDRDPHILAEIVAEVRTSLPPERSFLITAEDEKNDAHVVQPQDKNGFGVDALWADDFHHQIRVALTGEHEGYYIDYQGRMEDIAATLRQGWFYTGQPSSYLDRPRGTHADHIAPPRFIHCIQNHDQVGNRALGDRLNHAITLDRYRAASALLLLSPYTPLLWMGQEWAASTPFQFFTDHHPELGTKVTEGRRKEFSHFTAFSGKDVPDPQDRKTFLHSKLCWDERIEPPHAGVLRLYHDLLRLRQQLPALLTRTREQFAVMPVSEHALALLRQGQNYEDTLLGIVNLRGTLHLNLQDLFVSSLLPGARWTLLLDSEDAMYSGRGDTQLTEGRLLDLHGPGALLLAVAA